MHFQSQFYCNENFQNYTIVPDFIFFFKEAKSQYCICHRIYQSSSDLLVESYFGTMYWIFHFIFFSLIFGCWAADSEELQPLKIPDEIKMDGSRATLANMFKTFNINYLRSKFVPSTKTKEASISQRLLTTAGQLANSYKSLYSTNQFSSKYELAYIPVGS